MSNYKYIKRVNWPWVEIQDSFEFEDGTVVINVNDITLIWDRAQGKYKYGVMFKHGDWFDHLVDEALAELKDLMITHID